VQTFGLQLFVRLFKGVPHLLDPEVGNALLLLEGDLDFCTMLEDLFVLLFKFF